MDEVHEGGCVIAGLKTVLKLSNKTSAFKICGKLKQPNWKWQKIVNLTQECLQPCEVLEYRGTIQKSRSWDTSKNLQIFVSFDSYDVQVEEEYLVYGPVDIVGIIGGTMGLFIGFSFSGFMSYIITLLNDYFLS